MTNTSKLPKLDKNIKCRKHLEIILKTLVNMAPAWQPAKRQSRRSVLTSQDQQFNWLHSFPQKVDSPLPWSQRSPKSQLHIYKFASATKRR